MIQALLNTSRKQDLVTKAKKMPVTESSRLFHVHCFCFLLPNLLYTRYQIYVGDQSCSSSFGFCFWMQVFQYFSCCHWPAFNMVVTEEKGCSAWKRQSKESERFCFTWCVCGIASSNVALLIWLTIWGLPIRYGSTLLKLMTNWPAMVLACSSQFVYFVSVLKSCFRIHFHFLHRREAYNAVYWKCFHNRISTLSPFTSEVFCTCVGSWSTEQLKRCSSLHHFALNSFKLLLDLPFLQILYLPVQHCLSKLGFQVIVQDPVELVWINSSLNLNAFFREKHSVMIQHFPGIKNILQPSENCSNGRLKIKQKYLQLE